MQGRRCPATVGADERRTYATAPRGGKARQVGRRASQETTAGRSLRQRLEGGHAVDTPDDRSVQGRLILVTGGARSGKSTYAERLAAQLAEPRGGRVTYIATSQAYDEEMAQRVSAHQSSRPETWTTVECPVEVPAAVRAAAAGGGAGRRSRRLRRRPARRPPRLRHPLGDQPALQRRRLRRQRAAGGRLQLRQGPAAAGRGARRRGARLRRRRRPRRGRRRDRRHPRRRHQRGRARGRPRVPARPPVPRSARLGQPAPRPRRGRPLPARLRLPARRQGAGGRLAAGGRPLSHPVPDDPSSPSKEPQ